MQSSLCVLDKLSASTVVSVVDLEWKITWVGSSESVEYDQVLDQVFVGPVTRGQYKFVFEVGLTGCQELLSKSQK